MSALDDLQIATPCPMKWSQMKGDERVRRCDRCRLDVYNLTAMTTRAATKLIGEGSACVTFRRRADGTVITRDCRGGFSDNFWEKFGSMERSGLIFLFGAAFTALTFAVFIMLFGDNIRALFGQGTTGALAGDPTVVKRSRPVPKHADMR